MTVVTRIRLIAYMLVAVVVGVAGYIAGAGASDGQGVAASQVAITQPPEAPRLESHFERIAETSFFPAATERLRRDVNHTAGEGRDGDFNAGDGPRNELVALLPVDAVVAFISRGGGEWTAVFANAQELDAALRQGELEQAGWLIEDATATRVVLVKDDQRVVFDAFGQDD